MKLLSQILSYGLLGVPLRVATVTFYSFYYPFSRSAQNPHILQSHIIPITKGLGYGQLNRPLYFYISHSSLVLATEQARNWSNRKKLGMGPDDTTVLWNAIQCEITNSPALIGVLGIRLGENLMTIEDQTAEMEVRGYIERVKKQEESTSADHVLF